VTASRGDGAFRSVELSQQLADRVDFRLLRRRQPAFRLQPLEDRDRALEVAPALRAFKVPTLINEIARSTW
jgi:hypothetical protein